ncbi:MAG: SDR family NAD(P)-dependent oxidoreductase [Actinobacteria bacterium]|jgi:short-subunit dehydrogenase|nr:MAG: SDR family NAD(P)-dependent oxidoreductase [Actinomycetota bacterium]
MSRRLSSRGKGPDWFKGRIVLVTGAASGLGRGIALAFARAGCDLVLVDVDEAGLGETASMVEAVGSRIIRKRIDVSSRDEMEKLADEVLSQWGRVDVLVNNAGVGVGGELDTIPLDDIEWITGINLMGEVYGTRLFLPQMVQRGEGHIVNVGSLSSLIALPLHIAYTTTKFGLAGFSEVLWAEARNHGVGVTLVCPGAVSTNIGSHTRSHYRTEKQRANEEKFAAMLAEKGMDPQEAGRLVFNAVAANKFLLLLGREAYIMYYFKRFFPGLQLRLVSAVSKRLSK